MKTPWWFLSKNPISLMLVPVSWVYYGAGRVVYFVRKLWPLKSRRPIICVGNILAGGVGKTPVVRAIANRYGAPVVMRGYKKSAKTGNIGDEATMLARTGLAVHVGDRKSNILLLNKQDDNTPIIMDDGLQNPTFYKDIPLLIINGRYGLGMEMVLCCRPGRCVCQSVWHAMQMRLLLLKIKE